MKLSSIPSTTKEEEEENEEEGDEEEDIRAKPASGEQPLHTAPCPLQARGGSAALGTRPLAGRAGRWV